MRFFENCRYCLKRPQASILSFDFVWNGEVSFWRNDTERTKHLRSREKGTAQKKGSGYRYGIKMCFPEQISAQCMASFAPCFASKMR